MGNLSKVLLNLAIYTAILFIGIKLLSKVFDIGIKKFTSLNPKLKQ